MAKLVKIIELVTLVLVSIVLLRILLTPLDGEVYLLIKSKSDLSEAVTPMTAAAPLRNDPQEPLIDQMKTGWKNLSPTNPPVDSLPRDEEVVLRPKALLNKKQIETVLKLVKIEQPELVVMRESKVHAGSLWDTELHYFIILNGMVMSRLDLKRMDIKINNDEKSVEIRLKHGVVSLSKVIFDPDHDFEFLVLPDDWDIEINEQERRAAQHKAQEQLREKAIAGGIQKKTLEKTKVLLEQFLKTFGYKVTVKLADVD